MSDFPPKTLTPSAPPDRTFAILAHIGGLFLSWVGPLILYLIKKSEPNAEFDTEHAKEALNFQITLIIAYMVCGILMIVVIGFFLIWLVMLANLVLSIIAAVKASNGEIYRYPLTLRLIK